jgi:alpha/beta superfamily hydrolase
VLVDINTVEDAKGAALLLHPHPGLGGNRLHPFVDGLFVRLPGVGVTAVRFDFSSDDVSVAAEEAGAAVTDLDARQPGLPIVVAGYSFGAAVATKIFDDRVVGWYLLAPPVDALTTTAIGFLPRPKAVVVPELDQYFPPPTIAPAISRWQATDASTLPHVDHFLAGGLEPVIESAVQWIAELFAGIGGE